MNKIYSGVIAIVAVVAVVAGSAFAAFTATAEINGITLGTTTSGLLVRLGAEDNETDYQAVRTIDPQFNPTRVSPGTLSSPGVYQLKNSGDVDLNLAARVTNANGDWDLLKDKIYGVTCLNSVATHDGGGIPTSCPESAGPGSTGWRTLSDWNAAPIALPGSPLLAGAESEHYVSFYTLAADADNSYAGKTLTNFTIDITGTQVNP